MQKSFALLTLPVPALPFADAAANSTGAVVVVECRSGSNASRDTHCLAPGVAVAVVQIPGYLYRLDQYANFSACGSPGYVSPASISENGIILIRGINALVPISTDVANLASQIND